MAMTIILSGGPADGRQVTIPNDQPPPLYLIPIVAPLSFSLISMDPFEVSPTRCAEYEPVYEHGWPSRPDDGAVRYRHRGTPEPLHPGQRRPTPTLDELAAMFAEPPVTSYRSNEAHLLACRTRFSLRREARMTEEERGAFNAVVMAHAMAALRERHMP
jgi:hypothetical protein